MIIAVGACLLMIAGEFDLSVGSMIGFSGIVIAISPSPGAGRCGRRSWSPSRLPSRIGALNGYLVITGLPSFIVTLAFLFILRGFTIFLPPADRPQDHHRRHRRGGRRRLAGADIRRQDALRPLRLAGGMRAGSTRFESGTRRAAGVDGIPMLIVWALALVIVGHILLTRTRFGNWIFASGGDAQAARYVGVPVNRVKILMFMFTAFCATVFATCQVMEFGSAGADRGLLKEFEAIIAVVIGGALLTGGYGSVIGRRPRRADLRRRAAGTVLRRCGKLAFPGVPRRHPAARGHSQHLHPPHDHRRTLRWPNP